MLLRGHVALASSIGEEFIGNALQLLRLTAFKENRFIVHPKQDSLPGKGKGQKKLLL